MRDLLKRTKDLGHPDLPLLGVSLAEGVRPRADDDGRPAASLDLSGYKRVREGDIIMNALGKPHGSIGRSPQEGITSPAYWVMEPNTLADSRFLHYMLRSEHMVNEYQRLGKYLPPNQFDISWDDFCAIEVPLPPVQEQRRIADFLDDQVARIDALVKLRQVNISRLKELTRSTITAQVTGSSDADATRVSFLPDPLPKGWRGACLRWVSRIYAGGTPSRERPEYWNEGTIPWLNSGAVNDWAIHEPSEFITEEGLAGSSARWIPASSVVLALAGQGKTKGKAARLEIETTCNQSMAAVVPGRSLEYRFLHFWLAANYERIRNLGGGDLRDGLNLQMVGDIPIPLPPVEEQRRIADYLDSYVDSVERREDLENQGINLLEERKRALITAAVTGELDVTTARPIGMGQWVPNIGAGVEAPAAAQGSSIGGIG